MTALVTSCRIVRGPAHDVVRVWNRGGLAGELTVQSGDGMRVAARLTGMPDPPSGITFDNEVTVNGKPDGETFADKTSESLYLIAGMTIGEAYRHAKTPTEFYALVVEGVAVLDRALRNLVAILDGDGGQKQTDESVSDTFARIVPVATVATWAARYVRERVTLLDAVMAGGSLKHGPGCERMSDGGDANDERADTCGADCDYVTMAAMSNRLDAIDDEMRALVRDAKP